MGEYKRFYSKEQRLARKKEFDEIHSSTHKTEFLFTFAPMVEIHCRCGRFWQSRDPIHVVEAQKPGARVEQKCDQCGTLVVAKQPRVLLAKKEIVT